jgi:hypothetical protein
MGDLEKGEQHLESQGGAMGYSREEARRSKVKEGGRMRG